MKNVTRKQQLVLDLVIAYREEHGYSPSIGDLADALLIARPTALQHLLALEKKGMMTHTKGVVRSWRPVSALARLSHQQPGASDWERSLRHAVAIRSKLYDGESALVDCVAMALREIDNLRSKIK